MGLQKISQINDLDKLGIYTDDREFIQFMQRNGYRELLEAIIESNYFNKDDGYINFLIETVLINNLEQDLFENRLKNEDLYFLLLERYLNENTVKDWFLKKKEQVKKWVEDGLDKAKEKGVQFINKLKSFGDVVKVIKTAILEFLKKAWDIFKKMVTSKYDSIKKEILHTWEKWAKDESEHITAEIKHFKGMAKACIDWALNKFPGEAEKAVQDVGNKDINEQFYSFGEILEKCLYIVMAELIKEDKRVIDEIESIYDKLMYNIYESEGIHTIHIPFLSKIVHKLAHLKPFVYLTNIEHWVGEKTNNIFHKISIWVNKFASGPEPYEYKYMGQIIGLMSGHIIKGGLKSIVHEIGETAIGAAIVVLIPGISWILTMLKYTATGIWIVEVGELALKGAQETVKKIKK